MQHVSQGLSTTSYALLGLLALDGDPSSSLTGYELKQRADRTLRFYWVSPAMSQVYTELDRLSRLGFVEATEERSGRRTSQHYRLTAEGVTELNSWLSDTDAEFPVLKHPVALRLLMGGLVDPQRMRQHLQRYLDQLEERSRELAGVRAWLGETESLQYPAMVAEWGLDYYASETEIVRRLTERLATLPTPAGSAVPSGRAGEPG
jgi:DNA-binding PadR family transcriptional regulator